MLFSDLTEPQRAIIEKAGVRRHFTAGERIIREGAPDRSLFVVLRGLVEVRKELDANRYRHLKDLGVGDCFGEIAFLGASMRTATVVAVEDSDVLELPIEAVERLEAEAPAVVATLFRTIARELAGRLTTNTEELRKAVLWAIEGIR